MQVAVRVVGGEASRPFHLRAQLLEKLSATAWPRVELKGVGVDVWPAWLGVQPPDLYAGKALNHLAENRVGKANVQQALILNLSHAFSIVF